MQNTQTGQDTVRDPYQILELSNSADPAEIKKAYRKLAKDSHPDRHPGDSGAQERFAEINSAYEILGDKDKRGQFDRGEIDAEGKPRFQGFDGFGGAQGFQNIDPSVFAEAFGQGSGRSPGGARTFRFTTGGGPQSGGGADDILNNLFGAGAAGGAPGAGMGGQRRARRKPKKGTDIKAKLAVTLEDIASGKKPSVRLPNGKTIAMALPKMVENGQTVRLKGQGDPSATGGRPGDALVRVKIVPHPLFTPDGADLRLELPVGLHEAVLGAKIAVPTLSGKVHVSIPPQTSGGRVLRLKGKGLPGSSGPGDLLVRIAVKLPDKADEALTRLMEEWQERGEFHPRDGSFD